MSKLIATLVLIAAAPFQSVLAQAPLLGTAQSFAVLGASTVTNTGPTIITGDLGVSPGTSITGFPPGIVLGTVHANDAVALQAQSDTTTAYNTLAGEACNTTFGVPTDIGGMTLLPGVYCFSSSAQLTGTVTLDAQGNPNAVFIFKIASTLITASNSSVLLINGAQPCNVFWQVGSSATIGTSTRFVGSILALTSISLNTNASLAGRALARTGAVTLDSNTVTASACAVPPVTPIPPTLGKAFSPATINAGGTSTLTITLGNTDNTAASLTSPLTDTLPSGVVVAGSATNTCGGTVTAVTGSSTVILTGGTIPANSFCTVTVAVIAPNGGNFINTLAAGALQTSNGNNAAPAIATLTVLSATIPPTVGKTFSPATINAGGTSTMTITLSNTNSTAATLTSPLTDTLPSGVVVAGSAANTCGGTVTAVTGSSTVTLTGGAIPANGSCTVTVDVTAANGGNFINTLAAGGLQTSKGNNAAPAIATLTVLTANTPPALGKTFSPATINAGGTSTMTITLSNTNSTAATLTSPLTDTLPSGVVVAGSAANTCGGTVTAVTGSSTVTLTGGAIPANGSCTVTVDVTAANGGNFINTLAAGALQTSNGNNAAPAIATLTVLSATIPPTVGKTFSPATINAGGTSTMTLTLSNTNSTAATLTSPLTDTLPSGVVVAGSAANTCGGTVTAVTGSSTVTLSGGAIPANGSCTVTVDVTAANGGNFINTLAAGALQTSNGNNAAPAIATLTVLPTNLSPTLAKSFSPATINAGGTSTTTLTLSNTNSTAATLTSPLTDTLPSGVVVVGNAANTCGGTVTAVTGSSTVTLTGGSIPAHGSCTVTVNVTASAGGTFVNTLPVGALQTSTGSNTVPATATLNVLSVKIAHFECQFVNYSKPSGFSCNAIGSVCIEERGADSCRKNSLEVRCSNGFRLEDHRAKVNRESENLSIRGFDNDGSAFLEIMGGTSGEHRSSLTLKDEGLGRLERLFGLCRFR